MCFDEKFDKSELPNVLTKAKTLSKEECRAIYNYISEKKPKVILEFGTQFGCSTRAFREMANWIGYELELHSWDIVDRVKCIDKKDFIFHLQDVTGNEKDVFDKYHPYLLFLDAHPYNLTKNLMSLCLDRKINFMMHDIAFDVYEVVKNSSKNFTNFDAYGAWELYVLAELISKDLLEKDYYEDDKVRVKCVRDKYGLSIIEVK